MVEWAPSHDGEVGKGYLAEFAAVIPVYLLGQALMIE